MRRARLGCGQGFAPAAYGLRLTVSAGSGGSRNVAAIVKPLIDGVVAGLHNHDGSQFVEVASRLAGLLAIDSAQVAELLMTNEDSILGTRRLLWTRANGVQWNPGDDTCVAAQVLLRTHSGTGWSHSGEVFEVTSRR